MPTQEIALVMIVRNEAARLGRCLESAKPHVDRMVVIDTGSTDSSVQIARSFGANVGFFGWVDDFSAARNCALDLADADWNLILDADEWVISGGETLRARLGAKPLVGVIEVASDFVDVKGVKQQSIGFVPRILPRGVRYRGRLHEAPETTLPRFRLPMRIGHDGYVNTAHKRGRNLRILHRMLAETPDDSWLSYIAGREYELANNDTTALRYYDEALKGAPPQAGWRHDLVIRRIGALKRLGDHQRALSFAEKERARWDDSPDFFFVLGDLLLDYACHHPEQANTLLPMIESCWLRCIALGDNGRYPDSVHGRGSHLAEHNLRVLYEQLGGKPLPQTCMI